MSNIFYFIVKDIKFILRCKYNFVYLYSEKGTKRQLPARCKKAPERISRRNTGATTFISYDKFK